MEVRMKKCRQLSPENARVGTESSLKDRQQQLPVRKIPVVYYLYRNRHLEHPHIIEVPIISNQGLYLRDVIHHLKIRRGKRMSAMYSWSCKRRYKNGFVWHDLCDDDLILPAHGNEYVLKGSEILVDPPTIDADRHVVSTSGKSQNLKQMQEPVPDRSPGGSSSSSSIPGKESKCRREENTPYPKHPTTSSVQSIESMARKSPRWGFSPCLMESDVYKATGAADASTQTEESGKRAQAPETCTRGVSTDDGFFGLECRGDSQQNLNLKLNENPELGIGDISPPSSSTTSGGKIDTLESLIRAEACKVNSFRILEEEEVCAPLNTKLKPCNVIMQLISCGSISVKDRQSSGLIPTYKPSFSHGKLHSPFLSSSVMLGELDCFTENSKFWRIRLDGKEYYTGSLMDTRKHEDAGISVLKQSISYNANRQKENKMQLQAPTSNRGNYDPGCIPLTIEVSSSKHAQPRNKTIKSTVSDGVRNSSAGSDSLQSTSHGASKSNREVTSASSRRMPPKRLDSFKQEVVVKMEERLSSGARVIIQSTASGEL